MRIIGGDKRGKKLAVLEGEQTRPTSDRARESLFNLLNNQLMLHQKQWNDVVFVDVFAGTGAVGVEAYSRGANKVFFFENNTLALKCLYKNIDGFLDVTVYKEALKPPQATSGADIIFMDPPYAKGLWEKAVPIFYQKGWINKQTIVVIEVDKTEKVCLPEGFYETDKRSYGRNTFIFLMLGQRGE